MTLGVFARDDGDDGDDTLANLLADEDDAEFADEIAESGRDVNSSWFLSLYKS